MQISRYWRQRRWLYRLEVSDKSGAPRWAQEYARSRSKEGEHIPAESKTELMAPSMDEATQRAVIQGEIGLVTHETT